jgi:hypothetical protein
MLFTKKNKTQNINKPGENQLTITFLNKNTIAQKEHHLKQETKIKLGGVSEQF